MEPVNDDLYVALCEQSRALHQNKNVLPVACTMLDREEGETITSPEVTRGLDGRVTTNRVLEACERLCEIGALREWPRLGPPHPRTFELRASPYWDLSRAYCRSAATST